MDGWDLLEVLCSPGAEVDLDQDGALRSSWLPERLSVVPS